MKHKNPTILIVDDTQINIDILIDMLSIYDVAVAIDGKSALEISSEDEINLILLDIMMPDMDGYEVCKRLKENQKTKDIPVIFITSRTDEESIEKAYEVGGIDYITKPFKHKELLARVKTQLDMQLLIKELNFLACHDSMTGIYNRRKFFKLSEKLFQTKENLFAVMLDIDKFKYINDTYGHAAGDKVIKKVTSTVTKLLDSENVFGRIGGEEFAIICIDGDKESILDKAEYLRKQIESLEVSCEQHMGIHFTISIGVAKKSTHTSTLDELLRNADLALYEAKNNGRNNIVFMD